ncbi:MAG: hypothetical protein J6V59_06245 [Alistipes sp.]|nr:hypothetical protein [Alistipes sp.]
MHRVFRYIVFVVALVVGAVRLHAQELKLGAEFTTLFDNREYASMTFDGSGTLFSACLSPEVGIVWAERNELMFGIDMIQDFGHDAKFLSDIAPSFYYGYRAPRVKLFAGIIPRDEMRGLRSSLYFDRRYTYYNNNIAGVLARYENPSFGSSYLEFAMDYTGMRSYDTRESFMIMMSGYMPIKWFYMGFDFLMGHYAKDYNPDTNDGVVDNLMLTPFVGADISIPTSLRDVNLDVRVTYVQSLQRDRIMEGVWETPRGGEVFVEVEWYDVRLSNRLYLGRGSLFTYFDRYGEDLYHGSPLYRTDRGIYDAVELSYCRSFFDGTVSVEAGMTMEYDGTGWGTRQWLSVGAKLGYGINLKRKQHYIE